eukprot:PhM_4_TR2643/c0_g1_i1/m.76440
MLPRPSRRLAPSTTTNANIKVIFGVLFTVLVLPQFWELSQQQHENFHSEAVSSKTSSSKSSKSSIAIAASTKKMCLQMLVNENNKNRAHVLRQQLLRFIQNEKMTNNNNDNNNIEEKDLFFTQNDWAWRTTDNNKTKRHQVQQQRREKEEIGLIKTTTTTNKSISYGHRTLHNVCVSTYGKALVGNAARVSKPFVVTEFDAKHFLRIDTLGEDAQLPTNAFVDDDSYYYYYLHPIVDYRINNVGHVLFRMFASLLYLRNRVGLSQDDIRSHVVPIFAVTAPKEVEQHLDRNLYDAFAAPLFPSKRSSGSSSSVVVLDLHHDDNPRRLNITTSTRFACSPSFFSPATACFHQLYFGWEPIPLQGLYIAPEHDRIVKEYVALFKQHYGIGAPDNQRRRVIRITIVQRRRNRRLLHVNNDFIGKLMSERELMEVRLVDFESVSSVAEQARLVASETDVLVGATGAALCFSVFLPPNSVVLEIVPPRMYKGGAAYAINELGFNENARYARYASAHHVALAADVSRARVDATRQEDHMSDDIDIPPKEMSLCIEVAECVFLAAEGKGEKIFEKCHALAQRLLVNHWNVNASKFSDMFRRRGFYAPHLDRIMKLQEEEKLLRANRTRRPTPSPLYHAIGALNTFRYSSTTTTKREKGD